MGLVDPGQVIWAPDASDVSVPVQHVVQWGPCYPHGPALSQFRDMSFEALAARLEGAS